jgi:hypothetical protein
LGPFAESQGTYSPAQRGIAVYDHGDMNDMETSLRAENAELRRLLEKHQWAGCDSFSSACGIRLADFLPGLESAPVLADSLHGLH